MNKKQVVRKINKIKSVREILDFNKDGKVSQKELDKGMKNTKVMGQIKKISPMTYYLIKNQNVDFKVVEDRRNVRLIQQEIKSFKKYRDMFRGT
jgi:hypothetical protein